MTNKFILISVTGVLLMGVGFTYFIYPEDEIAQPIPTPTATVTVVKSDLIKVSSPLPSQEIESPLEITGEARGYWYFEASFPIHLLDGNGIEIAVAPAQAQSEWMTTDFVPFKLVLLFDKPTTPTGTLVLKKDNPSGLPEHDDEIRIPVRFK